MVETKTIAITLPDNVWNSAMELAASKKLSLDAFVGDAIVRYEKASKRQDLLAYGRKTALASGYREEDAVGLCKETRAQIAAERASEASLKPGL